MIKGSHHSKETKRKIGKGNLGKRLSEETKRKMSESQMEHFHTKETKRKMSEAHQGEKNPNWKGGITSLKNNIRDSFLYRQWRSDIYTRDDFTCRGCNRRGGNLHAHHINTFFDILELNDIKTLEQALGCHELWNINNGVTYCQKCHEEKHQELSQLS